MNFIVYGNEPYKVDLQMKKLIEDTECLMVSELTSECQQQMDLQGFLMERTLCLKLNSVKADEELLKFLRLNENKTNKFIIVVEKVNENTKIFKLVKKSGKVYACNKLTINEFKIYLDKALMTLKTTMTDDAKSLFISQSGYFINDEINLYTVNILLKQLAFHTAMIKVNDINKILYRLPDTDSRDLTRMLFSKDFKGFMLKAYILANTKEPMMIMGLLLRNFRIAFKASLYQDKSSKDVMNLLNLNSYQMRGVSDAMKLSPDKVNRCINLVLRGTNDIKDGALPARISFLKTMGDLVNIIK